MPCNVSLPNQVHGSQTFVNESTVENRWHKGCPKENEVLVVPGLITRQIKNVENSTATATRNALV